MTRRILITGTVLFVLISSLFLGGCTLVGAAIGHSYYSNEPTSITILKSGAVRKGTNLVITMTDSMQVEGLFLEIQPGDETSLPNLSAHLVLERKADTVFVPCDKILTVEAKGATNAWLVGMGIGAAFDIALFLWSRDMIYKSSVN